MTNDRLRTTLAAAALAATVSIAGVASAHETSGKGSQGGGKSKPCGSKGKGKGYEVQGAFAWADLEQVAGVGTARTNDDRFSGTVVVDVAKGNRRGRRDLGLSLYTVTGVRVIGAAADGTLPAEGARVQLVGKQLAAKQARSCDSTPTTPEPTTPTEPESTATRSGRPTEPKTEEPSGSDDEDTVVASDDDPASDDRAVDDEPKPDADAPAAEDDPAADADAAAEDDAVDEEPTAVADVAIRVVHFKVRPASARR